MVPISIQLQRLLDLVSYEPFSPDKCQTCSYREPDVEGAHCYMYKSAPEIDCGAYRKDRFCKAD